MAYFIADGNEGGIFNIIAKSVSEASMLGFGKTFIYLSPITTENSVINPDASGLWYCVDATLGGNPIKYYVLGGNASVARTYFSTVFPSAIVIKISFFATNG